MPTKCAGPTVREADTIQLIKSEALLHTQTERGYAGQETHSSSGLWLIPRLMVAHSASREVH
jgi:hypothetical protein